MLDISYENIGIEEIVVGEETIVCDTCNDEAVVFQEEGNFCLNCWQARTEPDISART